MPVGREFDEIEAAGVLKQVSHSSGVHLLYSCLRKMDRFTFVVISKLP